MLEIDPAEGTTCFFGGWLPANCTYDCPLVEAQNGKLYAAPYNGSRVLEVDPAAGQEKDRVRLFDRVSLVDHADQRAYCSLAAASNGRLYAVTEGAHACNYIASNIASKQVRRLVIFGC